MPRCVGYWLSGRWGLVPWAGHDAPAIPAGFLTAGLGVRLCARYGHLAGVKWPHARGLTCVSLVLREAEDFPAPAVGLLGDTPVHV